RARASRSGRAGEAGVATAVATQEREVAAVLVADVRVGRIQRGALGQGVDVAQAELVAAPAGGVVDLRRAVLDGDVARAHRDRRADRPVGVLRASQVGVVDAVHAHQLGHAEVIRTADAPVLVLELRRDRRARRVGTRRGDGDVDRAGGIAEAGTDVTATSERAADVLGERVGELRVHARADVRRGVRAHAPQVRQAVVRARGGSRVVTGGAVRATTLRGVRAGSSAQRAE